MVVFILIVENFEVVNNAELILTHCFLMYFSRMSKESKGWILLVVLAVIWGASFILMKKAMYAVDGSVIFTHTQVGALRMAIASIVMVPFAVKALRMIESLKEIFLLCVVGFSGNFLPAFLYTYAETGVSSGYAGMLTSFTPIFALLIGFVIFKERLSSLQLLGVFIGTIGVVLLMLAGANLSISGGWSHVLSIVAATLCYAISLNTIKYTLQKFNSVQITSLAFMFILIPSLWGAWASGAFDAITENEHAFEGVSALLILSVLGTAFAVLLFNKLVAISSVIFASSVTYLIPVVAVIIGLYFNESISLNEVLAMVIILTGVFIANYLPKMNRFSSK